MQKSTIFVVILAALVIFSVADVIVNKPFSADLSANITANVAPGNEDPASDPDPDSPLKSEDNMNDSADSGNFPDGLSVNPSEISADVSPVASLSASENSDASEIPDVSTFLQKRTFALQKITIEDLMKSGFQNIKLEQASFDQMLFQLLDLAPYPNISALRLHLTDSKNVFGILHEFEFENSSQSALLYADLKQKIGAFSPNVTSNQTNQYGDNSYYMNDKNRSGTAFLVFRIKNHLFAFSYPKASHEFFKSLIRTLENP